MREYELTVLIHPDLEADIEKPLEKIRKIISDNKGEILVEDNWGKKKLAYKIAKESFANYVYFEVKLPATANAKVSQTLNITDEILRYLLVSVDEKARQAMAEAKAKASEKEEE
jgi:small subunit ribosomal protein S6